MSKYPEALIQKIAVAMYEEGGRGPDDDDMAWLRTQARAALDALGLRVEFGRRISRAAILERRYVTEWETPYLERRYVTEWETPE